MWFLLGCLDLIVEKLKLHSLLLFFPLYTSPLYFFLRWFTSCFALRVAVAPVLCHVSTAASRRPCPQRVSTTPLRAVEVRTLTALRGRGNTKRRRRPTRQRKKTKKNEKKYAGEQHAAVHRSKLQ
ncbi:uncharacterized protein Tco025E_00040 [Trypanosoma conorhini]|uniref:Uncharacterized protein n=1 Tax=Trypanosoma conorhini TaxID=83891 RepID=A0A3R7LFY8_9TRYP|nr:uncharacterized protein Tco025E_00040 [Trypanosoma conorhini]RNF27656.1 hypothetical protein Tco025E_00040 [Trypanosoma conorhini]